MKSLNISSAIPTTISRENNLNYVSPVKTKHNLEKVLFIGGVHGDEHLGKLLVYKLYEVLVENNHVLNDHFEFTFYPVANPAGSLANTRQFTTNSNHDLNRINMYNENILRSRIETLINEHDIIIDIHNSIDVINCFLFTMNKDYHHEIDLCERANVNILTRYSKGLTIKDYAKDLGKLAFTYEFSGMNSYEYPLNIVKAINDITSLLTKRVDQREIIASLNYPIKVDFNKYLIHELYSDKQGTIEFVYDKIMFDEGEPVANIYYTNDSKIFKEEILAPEKLKVVAKGNMYVGLNDSILLYQKIK